ncbi:MAG: acyl-CoA carboxylase epsilon subunit, partial [Pseudonocardiaceae bacterium]
MSDDACGHSPAIRILRGDPSAEELAALIATLAALRGVAGAQPPA